MGEGNSHEKQFAACDQRFAVEGTVELLIAGRDTEERSDRPDCICCPGPHNFARGIKVDEYEGRFPYRDSSAPQDWISDMLSALWREHRYALEGRRVRLTMELLPLTAATGREWDSLSVEEKVERLSYTLSTLASWLASAQTGFGNQDVLGIWNLLHHGSAKDVGE